MSTQQTEALALADWLEAVGGGPRAKRCAALLREQRFDAADMATASAQGFRDGVASAALASAPAQAAEPSITLDFKMATDLLGMFCGEPGLVTLQRGDEHCHSGPGLYAWYSDMPEEGAGFLGAEPDDEATPSAPSATAQPVAEPAKNDAAYAELPEPDIAVGNDGRALIYTSKDIVGAPYYAAGQLRAFADATCALRASHGQAPASVLHLVNSAFAEIAMAFPKAFALHKVGIADKAVLEALAAPAGAQADSVQEDAALVCDYCGALTPDPWHSSGMLHGKMSKHIHSCDACAARGAAQAQAAKQQEQLI